MSSRALLRSLFGFLPCLLGFAPADDGLRPGETVRETDAAFPGAETLDADDVPTVWPVRIMDAWTGRPIPGATVRVPNNVEGGATPEDIFDLCSGTADADGWVRLPYSDARGRRDYILADAPGFVPNEYCDFGSESCSLTPGVDVPVVVLDYTGLPVAGARVAVNLGCGHIPDQREAVADADGRAILRSVDPARRDPCDLWIDSPRLHRGTARLSATWRPGDPPVPIHASPGVVVEGRFLDLEGRPVKGARVGARDRDRPWVHTDAEGRFRLVGVAPDGIVDVLLSDGRREAGTSFHAPPEGVFRTVRLGGRDSGVSLTIRVKGPEGEPAAGVGVLAVRPADGFTCRAPPTPTATRCSPCRRGDSTSSPAETSAPGGRAGTPSRSRTVGVRGST